MTATTSIPSAMTGGSLDRIGRIVRLHFVSRRTLIVQPWLIFALVFIIDVAIWVIIVTAGDRNPDFRYTGGGFFFLVYLCIASITAYTQTYQYAIGLGVTRRDYYLGTSVTFLLVAIGYSVAFWALGEVEMATNGWWITGHLFTALYFGGTAWWRVLVFFFLLVFVMSVGTCFAALWLRWKMMGIGLVSLVTGVLLVAAVAILTYGRLWGDFGRWFVQTGALGLTALLLIPAAACLVAGYAVIRGSTPRD